MALRGSHPRDWLYCQIFGMDAGPKTEFGVCALFHFQLHPKPAQLPDSLGYLKSSRLPCNLGCRMGGGLPTGDFLEVEGRFFKDGDPHAPPPPPQGSDQFGNTENFPDLTTDPSKSWARPDWAARAGS